MDISFSIAAPGGKLLVNDYKRSENINRIIAEKDGDYQFCFDNSFSTFNRKTIFFELIVETENSPESRESLDYEGLSPGEVYEVKVEEILDSVYKVKGQLVKARQFQDLLKSFEARDRNVVEENFFKVTVWSICQIILMLAVGALQVFMVRSLFDTGSKGHKIWYNFNKGFTRF